MRVLFPTELFGLNNEFILSRKNIINNPLVVKNLYLFLCVFQNYKNFRITNISFNNTLYFNSHPIKILIYYEIVLHSDKSLSWNILFVLNPNLVFTCKNLKTICVILRLGNSVLLWRFQMDSLGQRRH